MHTLWGEVITSHIDTSGLPGAVGSVLFLDLGAGSTVHPVYVNSSSCTQIKRGTGSRHYVLCSVVVSKFLHLRPGQFPFPEVDPGPFLPIPKWPCPRDCCRPCGKWAEPMRVPVSVSRSVINQVSCPKGEAPHLPSMKGEHLHAPPGALSR